MGSRFANAGGTNADWINAVYTILLGRPAGAGDLLFWNAQLAGGESRGDAALQIANSSENNAKLIEADYLKYLDRVADAAGLQFWLQQFAGGEINEDVVAGFTGSNEHYKMHS